MKYNKLFPIMSIVLSTYSNSRSDICCQSGVKYKILSVPSKSFKYQFRVWMGCGRHGVNPKDKL